MELAKGKVAMLVGCFAVTGCTGLGTPIGKRVPGEVDEARWERKVDDYARYYGNPRKLAVWRIVQWDTALANIQRANTGSNVGLAALAAAIGFRAANDFSRADTLRLASAGLFGMSMSEALVQVSRINVYSAGIAGMECALAAYGTPPANSDALDPLRAHADVLRESDGWARYQQVVQVRERAEDQLHEAMLSTVSRISRDVDDALMGSIISANSRGAGWSETYTSTLDATTRPGDKSSLDRQIENLDYLKLTDAEKIARRAQLEARKQAELNAHAAFAEALAEANAFAHGVGQRVARMESCSINGATASAERVGTALGVDLLGASEPLQLSRGGQASFRVYGGVPPYSAVVVGGGDARPVATVAQGGVATVTVVTTEATATTNYEIIVADSTRSPAERVQVVVTAP